MQPKWEDTQEIIPSWDDTTEGPSQLESGLRGAAQGAALGFADELAGAVGALQEPSNLEEAYLRERDLSRQAYRAAQQANPLTYGAGEVGGGVATGLLTGGGGSLAARAGLGALQGGLTGIGLSEGESVGQVAKEAIPGALIGAAAPVAVAGLSSGASKLADYFAPKLKSIAEKTAVKATGATGAQAAKFRPEAGRELLERGLIRAGDSPEAISTRLASELETAGGNISSALGEISDQSIQTESIINNLQNQVSAMQRNPSQAPVARQLQNIIDDIKSSGESTITPERAEEIKRGFNAAAKNWLDPEKGQAGKAAYGAYREAVEGAAAARPEIAEKFSRAKETYGLLSPIQEASEKRAQQLAQSPTGGLLDAASMSAGGGGLQGLAFAVGRRMGAQRLPSAMAVGTDKLSNLLSSGKLGRFAAPISNALSRGPAAAAATDFLLQQNNPEYRKLIRGEE